MKRLILAAGVAALAISAPAASKPGEKGGGHGGGGPKAGHVQQGGGHGGGAKADKGHKGGGQAMQMHGNSGKHAPQMKAAQDNRGKGQQRMAEQRGHGRDKAVEHAQKANDRAFKAQQRAADRRMKGQDRALARQDKHGRQFEQLADGRRIVAGDRNWNDLARQGVWVNGCPPGLAKKPVACVPPGQAKKMVGEPLSTLQKQVALRQVPESLRYLYQDTPDYYYRYGDGYMYRVNRQNDIVSSLLPLFGLGLTAGQQFPTAYSNYYMPSAYQPFYPNVPQYDYRYANGYVYQVDPYSGVIRDVDPMLGYGYGYGQMLPATYSAYNVPYQYRPAYQDTNDYYYRYAPGAIYQVDPQTSLITGIAALLGNGMALNQPLPAGYNAYNVPYDYRNQYYDTPDNWYRYSAGNIYRVDPTTQLVTAIVASILT